MDDAFWEQAMATADQVELSVVAKPSGNPFSSSSNPFSSAKSSNFSKPATVLVQPTTQPVRTVALPIPAPCISAPIKNDSSLSHHPSVIPFKGPMAALPSQPLIKSTNVQPTPQPFKPADYSIPHVSDRAASAAHKAADIEMNETGPNCQGHSLPCLLLTVKKAGPTQGKQFWTCPLKDKLKCNFFLWDSEYRTSVSKQRLETVSSHKLTDRQITVSLQWHSPQRFLVDFLPFDARLPALLKSFKDAEFDSALRKWYMPFTDHLSFKERVIKLEGLKITLVDVPAHLVKLVSETKPTNVTLAASLPSTDTGSAKKRKLLIDQNLLNTSLASFDCSQIAPKLWNSLMPFQKSGVQYIVERHGRGMIGDDMGLGKSLQAIALCAYFSEDWPVLIICPSSLRYNWQNEFLKWMPCISESDINVVLSAKERIGKTTVTIVSYDLVSKMHEELMQAEFNVIVCDESHYLKSETALRTKHTLPLLSQSRRCVLLSGTPCLSRPIELFTQIHALQPALFVHRQQFGIRYCAGVQGKFGWEFTGASNLTELHSLLKRFTMIRRLKVEVLTDLPPKRRQTVVFRIKDAEIQQSMREIEEKRLLKAIDSEEQSTRPDKGFPPEMLKLFASSGLAKLNFIKEYLDDLTESLDKYIVFAHHQKLLDALDSYFSTAGVSFIRIDGHTPQTSRQTLVDSFQNDGSVKVALLSITAASQGLTLTAASTVVFAELFWTPALLLQAEDRVNRIGQKNACNIIYLLGQGTVDDLIWPMVERKLEVLSAVMDGNSKQLEYDTERRTRDDDKPSAAATSASTIATSAQASTMNPTQPNIMSYFGKPQPTTHTDKSSIAAKRPNVCPELHDLSDAELRMIGLLE